MKRFARSYSERRPVRAPIPRRPTLTLEMLSAENLVDVDTRLAERDEALRLEEAAVKAREAALRAAEEHHARTIQAVIREKDQTKLTLTAELKVIMEELNKREAEHSAILAEMRARLADIEAENKRLKDLALVSSTSEVEKAARVMLAEKKKRLMETILAHPPPSRRAAKPVDGTK